MERRVEQGIKREYIFSVYSLLRCPSLMIALGFPGEGGGNVVVHAWPKCQSKDRTLGDAGVVSGLDGDAAHESWTLRIPVPLLGFSLYWAWLLAQLASVGAPAVTNVLFAEMPLSMMEFLARGAALCVIMFFARDKSARTVIGWAVPIASLAGVLSVAILNLAPMCIDGLLLTTLLVLAWVVMGAGDAFLLMGWLEMYRYVNMRNAVIGICLSSGIAAPILAIACALGEPVASAFSAALPVFSALCLRVSVQGAPGTVSAGLDRTGGLPPLGEESRASYIRLIIAIIAFGLVLGALQAFSVRSDELPIPFAVRAIATGVGGIIALGVMLGSSFGNEQMVYRVALPIMACGLLLVQVMGNSLLLASFMILTGFSLFDAISMLLLLRITALYELSPITSLGIGRLANTVGILAGQVAGHLLASIFAVSDQLISASSSLQLLLLIVCCGFLLNAGSDRSVVVPSCEGESGVASAPGPVLSRWERQCELVSMQYGLSPREGEVLTLLSRGRDASYVSTFFVISPHTAKTHIHNVYKKMDIHSQQTLIDIVEDAAAQLKD